MKKKQVIKSTTFIEGSITTMYVIQRIIVGNVRCLVWSVCRKPSGRGQKVNPLSLKI